VYRPGNDFELILTVKRETRHPVEGSFGNDFPSIYNHMRPEVARHWKKIFFLAFFLEKRPLREKFSKCCSRKNSSRHRSTCCVQISWNLADGKSV